MRKGFFKILICISISGYAQVKTDSIQSIKLDEIILNPLRHEQPKRKLAQQIESISKTSIEFQNVPTIADVLANSGKLTVQKSQQGGGSPVIRGFEASRVLLVVDGVRMNNLIYRSGHLQNSITVDRNMLEKVDVLFGPSSTLYGSDALGGAVYFQTKAARLLSQTDHKKISGSAISNYSSVNESKSVHVDVNVAGKKWAGLSSASMNDWGDLKMGRQRNGSNAYFGERLFYVVTNNGLDQQVANNDKYLQKFSGYKQYDFMQKVLFQASSSLSHGLNLQYSTTSDIPRYDRLTDVSANGDLRSAEWNYGPQKRFLAVYKMAKDQLFRQTKMNIHLSYQNIEESRINRNFGSQNRNSRTEKVSVLGFSADFNSKINRGILTYGVDVYRDDLNSSAFQENIITGATSDLDTRYPDGQNSSLRAEGFVSYAASFNPELSYSLSARAGYSILKSEMDTNFLNLPFTAIEQRNTTYSGAFGLVNNATKNIKLSFNLASAYRVPNIDDLSKIFESTPGILIVPNEQIKPEKSVTADLGITIWNQRRFQFENVFYITKLYDPIRLDTFGFNGQNTIEYEGQTSVVYANQNQGKGHITGFMSVIKAEIFKSVLFEGTFNFTQGSIRNADGRAPLDHIAPLYGKVSLTYQSKKVMVEGYLLYNGKKDLKDYSPSGEDNLQYAPANGAPSWQTYNLKTALSIIKNTTIFSGVENILDIQYRTFSSGINAPGRNFYVGAKYVF
ncbi:TonB-dependent receptor [Flavobacterium sp. CYK-4]|uniref:TonB-dependent receptor plug domain-containing protein n=1 Tax=Flavobacterium lotistagni TaxID=2709660 RepID=UPI00140CBA04|nr:TonB-dependent receptor [Flavobacterium lotistagni]NHM07962.1 TonB-dependent receptor [Flavobacterium lotistagni]